MCYDRGVMQIYASQRLGVVRGLDLSHFTALLLLASFIIQALTAAISYRLDENSISPMSVRGWKGVTHGD